MANCLPSGRGWTKIKINLQIKKLGFVLIHRPNDKEVIYRINKLLVQFGMGRFMVGLDGVFNPLQVFGHVFPSDCLRFGLEADAGAEIPEHIIIGCVFLVLFEQGLFDLYECLLD